MGKAASGIQIEKGLAADAESIYEIGTICFSDAWRMETVLHDMEGSHSEYFVARLDDRVIGYGCFWFIADEGQLVNIGVRPEFRKQGIGALILEKGIEEAAFRHMRTMFLEVRVSNEAAQNLYKKYDFQIAGLRKKVYELPEEDGYIMTREIEGVL